MLIDTHFYLKKAHDFNLAWKEADQLKTAEHITATENQYYQHKSDFMR